MLVNYLAGAAFTIFVALVIYVYRWMDSVKDNHLTHMEIYLKQTADNTAATSKALDELAIREQMRHERDIQNFEDMKILIRTHGL